MLPIGTSVGAPSDAWTRAVAVRSFETHDDHGSDLVMHEGRIYAAVSGADASGTNELRFATNATRNATLRSEQVTTTPDLIRTASIAVGPSGDVYIAFMTDPASGGPESFVATDASGSWAVQELPTTGDRGPIGEASFPDIAVRGDGTPVVVFQGSQQAPCTGNGDLFLTTLQGGAWATPTNITLNNANQCVLATFPALAVSGTNLHLAYRSVRGQAAQLHYRSGNLSNATDETVDQTSQVAEFGVDISTDSGTPHIAYVTNSSVSHAAKSGGSWSTTVVESGSGIAAPPSIATPSSGPAIAYSATDGGSQVFVERFYGGAWTATNVTNGDRDDLFPNIGAAGDRVHIVFLEINSPLGNDPFTYLYRHQAPRPTVDFNLTEGREFSGGERVKMQGRISPATVSEPVTITTERYRGGDWRPFDKKKTRTNSSGRWSYTHDPLPTGSRYRARAEVGDTIDHLRGKNPWVPFKVKGRRSLG